MANDHDSKSRSIICVGKILDIFLGRGIRSHEKTKRNLDGMAKTLAYLGATIAENFGSHLSTGESFLASLT